MPRPGDVVEIKDKNRIAAAVALSAAAGRLQVLTAEGRDFKIPSDKVYFSGPGLETASGKDSLLAALRRIDQKRDALKNEIRLDLIWEIVRDSGEARTPQELAALCFGKEPAPDETAAMIRALYSDLGYFRPRGSGFFPVDEKTVRTMEEGRRRQKIRRQWEEKFAEWLAGGGKTPPPEGSEKELHALKEYLISWDSTAETGFQTVKDLLRKAKIGDPDRLAEILTNAGLLEKDENLLLAKYRVPREFPQAVGVEAQSLSLRAPPFSGERLDLTALDVFSVDDPATADIDDALSLEFLPEGWRAGVHIADVSEFIPKDSLTDKEAHTRSSSIYLPDETITMLPPSVTEGASLKKGEIRPALSILADFHSNGQMTSWVLKETLVRVKERLTYDEADERVSSDRRFSKLYEIAVRFQEERIKSGAVVVQFPKIEILVDKASGRITLIKSRPKTESQILVSEWMIFANRLCANFCVQSGIPAIYRTQSPPGKNLSPAPGDWVNLLKQRRFLRKGEASVDPAAHHGLGVPAYLQMTSPIRRCGDLAVHRQLKAALRREAYPYSAEDLQAVLAYSERWVEISDLVERQWRKYWLLRYLEPKIGARFEAVVIEVNPADTLLFIPELSLEVNCVKTLKPAAEGDPLEVILEEVKPRQGTVRVRPA